MNKREPTDEDWARLNSGIPLSQQNRLYLSYNHCTTCGKKMDYTGNHIVGDGIYCDVCVLTMAHQGGNHGLSELS